MQFTVKICSSADATSSDFVHFIIHNRWEAHFNAWDLSFKIVVFESAEFEQILGLRERLSGQQGMNNQDQIDAYSDHYGIFQGNGLIAALRVTRGASGRLDCEEIYPAKLMENFRPILGSASKFVCRKGLPLAWKTTQILIENAWFDQLSKGIRLDIINVHQRAIGYYQKIGYILLADSFFYHPVWNTPSYVMLLPADPHRESKMKPLFKGINNPLPLSLLQKYVLSIKEPAK